MNKVKYNLKNAHYAMITIAAGIISYGTPKRIPGTVAVALSPEIERTPIAADGMKEYAVLFDDNGYVGDIEYQDLTDEMRVDMFGSTLGEDGVLIENKDDVPNPFALMFEFDGDVNKKRNLFYNCLATKPDINGETGTKNQTDKIKLSCRPAEDTGHVKASVKNDTAGAAVYNSWYSSVYLKAGGTRLSVVNATFDKNSGNEADIATTILKVGTETLLSVKCGDTVLTEDTDYTVTDNSIVIDATYLDDLAVGSTVLTFMFSNGNVCTLTINIIDTTN